MESQWQWELILDLIAHLLEPKTLAKSSCVSKSWHSILTSDHHWLSLCRSHYPSLSSSTSTISPHRLFSLLQTSSSRRLRRLPPCTPRISLSNLLFSVDIFEHDNNTPVLSILRSGENLKTFKCHDENYRIFRFLEDDDVLQRSGEIDEFSQELRVVWSVVMKGWGGAFVLMDGVKGKIRVMHQEVDAWFLEELPGSVCCARMNGGGGLVAQMAVELRRRRVERVSMGLMNGVEWSYLSVNDALLYLQTFLLN